MPMTAAAFSADGSVLAVAAETVITLWDPDKNALVSVLGDTLTPITTLCFTGNSEHIVTLSQGSNPQLTVWDLSKLSVFWSYKLCAEAISCTEVGSKFAVLALINSPNGPAVKDQDGIILLFDVQSPISLATWMVKKAKGGCLAFLPPETCRHHMHMGDIDGSVPSLLVYINSNHEYIIFNPNNIEEARVSRNAHKNHPPDDETGRVGYASIYGELSKFDIKQDRIPEISFVPSERPWETIFSGPSHVLPPLTKLCSTFLASLLEKRESAIE